MDLISAAGDTLSVSNSDWTFYLELGARYGWRPKGTLPPAGIQSEQWHGRYTTNESQLVDAFDAAGLAAALRRATEDPALSEKEKELVRQFSVAWGLEVHGPQDAPSLQRLIYFFNKGAFTIT
jgi:hypothetical protein